MKRLSVLVLSMTLFFQILHAEDRSSSRMRIINLDLNNCNVLRIFAHLWKDHALGETENGAWIVMNPDGLYQQIDWAFTPQRHATTWSGVLPENIVAQLHTHSEHLDPKPSGPDSQIAKRLNITVYTVTRKGIWRVSPDGTITREMEHNWFQDSVQRCGTE